MHHDLCKWATMPLNTKLGSRNTQDTELNPDQNLDSQIFFDLENQQIWNYRSNVWLHDDVINAQTLLKVGAWNKNTIFFWFSDILYFGMHFLSYS